MKNKHLKIFQAKMDEANLGKVRQLESGKLHEFIADAIELCDPDSVFISSDSDGDVRYVREKSISNGEEKKLNAEGHTIHYDGYHDQGRDPANTKYLVPPGMDLGENLRQLDKQQGLDEIKGFLKGSMKGRQMLVRILCLGPNDSIFSIPGIQVTDSAYVAHSEDLLYRPGFEQFKTADDSVGFFKVVHSSGELADDRTSVNVENRRIYIDIEDETVYSVNTQYAGNTVGFKKLCFRLAIRKADQEGWLAEHMFIMGVHGPGGRVTYFTGAFPSFCGKTSTAMITGETIVGDDLAYIRKIDGRACTVNVERGLFGIIQDVNSKDDPVIHKSITTPGEVIFSNILITDGEPYWLGDGREPPEKGVNHSGEWHRGKKDAKGKEIPLAHKNARYTIRISELSNVDEKAEAPEGVAVGGVIYGGRDSDTWVPVQQSFDWAHGVITVAASLESETTAAVIGKEGVRSFQPMSNLDFVSIPLGRYIQNHLDFEEGLDECPLVFGVNYFLKDKNGEYLNGMSDKNVWVKWMELRANGDAEAITAPTGHIPLYDDLKRLFKQVIGKEYAKEDYEEQFRLRIPECLAKLGRIERIYREEVADTPQIFFDTLNLQRERLEAAREKLGEYISPFDLDKLAVEAPG